MKLTSRTEYALLALIYLARHHADGNISVEIISQKQTIPYKFLEQILLALKRAGYLRSKKGQSGGYALAKDAEKITIAEIVRLFDGALAPSESVSKYFYEPTPIEKERKLVKLFRKVRDLIANELENVTLSEMC